MRLMLLFLGMSISQATFAYLGPGVSGGLLATVLGIFVTVLAAIFGVFYFPLKGWLKRKKSKDKRAHGKDNKDAESSEILD